MAINASFFSSKELAVGVGLDASNVGTAFAGTFTAIEADSVAFPTFNDLRVDRRGGSASGIMTATSDLFIHTPGSMIEVSISGLLTDDLYHLLVSNALGTVFSTNVLSIANAVTSNVTFEHNDSSVMNKTLTFAFNGVGGGALDDCVAIPGCVITSLTLSGDPNEDGGRMKFDLTAQSRTPMTAGSTFGVADNTMSSFSSAYVFLGDFSDHVKVHNADALLKSFSMTIDNPVVFGGFGGNGGTGAPQTYVRSVPEMAITINPVVKYDTNFDGLWELTRQTTSLTTPAFSMADNSTYTAGNRAIYASDATVTGLSWDEGDYLGLAIEMKVRGDADPSIYFKFA